MRIKTIIIDDEPLAALLIEGYVEKTPYLDHIATFSSAVEAIHSERLADADLIFCDIQMPTLNGLEFSKMIGERARIVFTTAFAEYALDGYRVNALDYLTKPISYSDFLASSQRALDWYEMCGRASVGGEQRVASIYVKSEYKLIRIDLAKLLYVEALKDYVKFVVDGEPKPILSLMNIKRAEEILPVEEFIRVHRSFIVRRDRIDVIERNHIIFGRDAIPIGDSYKANLKEYLNKWTL